MLEVLVGKKDKLPMKKLMAIELADAIQEEREFMIKVGGAVFFEEPEFTILELAQYCVLWLREVRLWGRCVPFAYHTVECEENPLLAFTPDGSGWRLCSPWQRFVCEERFSSAQVVAFAQDVLREVVF